MSGSRDNSRAEEFKRATAGALSDRLAPEYGPGQGLAYAMAIAAVIYFWAGAHYLLAGRHLKDDLAAVREG